MSRGAYYITTPIYYVNDVPHIGHAYTTVAADVLARFHRLDGKRVFFLTGTDEHGQKVQQAAAGKGVPPETFVDSVVVRFQELWRALDISNDDFIRTTEERHQSVVQKVLATLMERGEIYQGRYEGWYCLPDERFWTEKDLIHGACPECRRPVEHIVENNYFFRMGRHHDWLKAYIASHPDFILPASRRNEVLGFLDRPLGDLCISRPKSRLSWGIPLPFDREYVAYVWVDALVNYISAAGYATDDERFQTFWPADVHLIGKDILTTHAVYWSTLLHALDLPLPRTLFAHGWWTVAGEKMSKSRGNVVDPSAAAASVGVDAFRYFLLREVPFGSDGDFSGSALIGRVNGDLANDLGNLLSRTQTMIHRFSASAIRVPPGAPQAYRSPMEEELMVLAASLPGRIRDHLGRFEFHRALQAIWKMVNLANGYIERSAPWTLAKDPRRKDDLDRVLYVCAETLRIISILISPFMPRTAAEISKGIGQAPPAAAGRLEESCRWGGLAAGPIPPRGSVLFPKIESEQNKGKTMEMTPPPPPPSQKPEITIEDFRKIDLRAGRVVEAERIPGSNKLLKLQVLIGDERRQVVAGIGTKYRPEALIGKTVIIVANLQPATLMGVESRGMILAAGGQEVAALATFLEEIEPGTMIK